MPCIVPIDLVNIMREIERQRFGASKLEFGLYLKGEIQGGVFVVSTDVMLPPQTVTAAHIDFDPVEDGGDEYNGVIHRHPGAMHSFSGTDEEHINSNFMFSLLYAAKEIKTGVINIPTEFGRIRMSLDITIDAPTVDISHLDLDNIREPVYVPPVTPVGRLPQRFQGTKYGKSSYPHVPVVAHGVPTGYRGSVNNGNYTAPTSTSSDDKEDEKNEEKVRVIRNADDLTVEEAKNLSEYLETQDHSATDIEFYSTQTGDDFEDCFEMLFGLDLHMIIDPNYDISGNEEDDEDDEEDDEETESGIQYDEEGLPYLNLKDSDYSSYIPTDDDAMDQDDERVPDTEEPAGIGFLPLG